MEMAHLHMHSQHSVLDGTATSEEYAQRCNELGVKYLALTDHSTLSGLRDHYDACVKHDIKAILGVEAHVATGSRLEKISKSKRQDGEDSNAYYHLVLLAKNDNGLRNLHKMESIAWNDGFYGKPRVDFDLLDEYGEDIIATSACVSGPIARNFINEEDDRAMEWFNKLHGRFGDDFYMELQYHNEDIAPGLNKKLIELADKNGVKSIATMDCHHVSPETLWLQEAVLILNTSPKKNPSIDQKKAQVGGLLERYNYLYPDRKMTFEHAEVCLMETEYIYNKFVEQGLERPDLLSNTLEVAEKIG